MRRCANCGALRGEPDSCAACDASPQADGPSAGYDAALFATMASLEAESFWFTSRNELIAWALATYHGELTSFLEVGCGTGFVLRGLAERFPHLALWGSELFAEGLVFAQRRVPSATLLQMDARSIPFRERFDAVGAFDVLEHIDDDDRVLREMYAALRPGGLLLLSVPQHRWLWSPADDIAHHVRRYTARELPAKVSAAGFDVLRSTSFVSLLLGPLAVSRWAARWRQGDYDPGAEMRLPRFVNRALGTTMAAERALIRRGVNFGAGGSRLVVARRP